MGKHCYVNGAVKIESIFIGSRISLQVKLYEAIVEPNTTTAKRLLQPKVVKSKSKEDSDEEYYSKRLIKLLSEDSSEVSD